MAPRAPGVGTGFVSIGDYLDANQGTLAREHGDVERDLGTQGDAAQSAADSVIAADRANFNPDPTSTPGYFNARNLITGYQDQATALGSHGGVSDYFQKHFGDSSGQAGLDANLFGTAAAPRDLGAYLDSGLAAVQAPVAPAAEPGPTGTPDPDQAPYDRERTPGNTGGPGTLNTGQTIAGQGHAPPAQSNPTDQSHKRRRRFGEDF